jgi:hypothetical protein
VFFVAHPDIGILSDAIELRNGYNIDVLVFINMFSSKYLIVCINTSSSKYRQVHYLDI